MDENALPSPNTKSFRRRTRVVVAALLAGILDISPCQAQVTVIDNAHIAADGEAWAKQWIQWKQQFDQWEQQYFTMLDVVKSGPAFLQADQLQSHDLDDGLAQRCPSPSTFSGQLAQQHYNFCKLLVETDNSRYNVLVGINQQIAVRNQEMQAILAKRITEAGSSDIGALNAFNAEMRTFQSNVDHDVNNAKAALDYYESVIKAVKEQQALLTTQALKNSTPSSGASLLGGAIQGVTLQTALEGAKHW
jgi:hypothetical protein